MFRFPYMRAPVRNVQPIKRPEAHEHKQFMEKAAFSPQLSLMLSMVLKDGFCRNTAMDMLKNIYPYAEPNDKKVIDQLFGLREFSLGYRPNLHQQLGAGNALSKQERDLNLLRVLKRYASQDTVRMFSRLERSIIMQSDINRLLNRMDMLRNTKVSGPDDMLNTMESLLPASERSNIRNISNMMNLFKNMSSFRPEDIMKMWGMQKN